MRWWWFSVLNFYLNVEQFRTTLGRRCIVLISQVQMLNKLQKTGYYHNVSPSFAIAVF